MRKMNRYLRRRQNIRPKDYHQARSELDELSKRSRILILSSKYEGIDMSPRNNPADASNFSDERTQEGKLPELV